MCNSESEGGVTYEATIDGGLRCPECQTEHVIYDVEELQQGLRMCPKCLGSLMVDYAVIKKVEEVLTRQRIGEPKKFVPPKWLTVK